MILRTILAVAIGSLALWIMALNWSVAWRLYVRRQHASSWIPLLGGLLGLVALRVMPDPRFHAYLWVPLFLDWGCIPGLLDTLRFHLWRLIRRGPKIIVSVLLLALAPALTASDRLVPKWETTPTAWKSGAYTYDGAGNIIAIGDDRYRYDGVSRLVSATAHTPSFLNTETYQYDLHGNLLRTEKSSIPAAGDDVIRTTTVMAIASASNQLQPTADATICPPGVNCITGAHDASGNQISSNGIVTYRWDALGNMAELEAGTRVERYVYDADGRRIATIRVSGTTSESRRYALRGTDAKVLRELTDDVANGAHTWKWTKDYVYRGGSVLASIAGSDTGEITRHYHLDHLGTPRLVTDARGYRLTAHTYWPFGTEAPGSEGDLAERMKFTGHERDYGRDRGEDLDYMQARYYTPVAGRFLSLDPAANSDAGEPQTWNFYAYAANNPIAYNDPDGQVRKYFIKMMSGFWRQVNRGRAVRESRKLAEHGVRVEGPGASKASRKTVKDAHPHEKRVRHDKHEGGPPSGPDAFADHWQLKKKSGGQVNYILGVLFSLIPIIGDADSFDEDEDMKIFVHRARYLADQLYGKSVEELTPEEFQTILDMLEGRKPYPPYEKEPDPRRDPAVKPDR